jgi:6-phosphogluconolactonase (cycloisomerase 2 family)
MSKEMREMNPQRKRIGNLRELAWIVAVAITGVAMFGGLVEIAAAQKAPFLAQAEMSKRTGPQPHGGNLYMQTNEVRNAIVHYRWSESGALTEVECVPTGGAGSGVVSPIYHISRPNDFEGAGSVILTPDRRFLFVTNAGDNSVSSFAVSDNGDLTLVDTKRTGNTTRGGAKSLAYTPSSRTLFVVHTFGPDHIRLMSVDNKGKLTPRPERYTVGTTDWPRRVPTMAVLSPDGKFLILGTTFDELPTAKNPDGSLILWIPRNGKLHLIASNAPDPDGLVTFPVNEDGSLGKSSLHDAGGISPFYLAFLHGRPDTFVVGYAVSNAVSMGTIDADGKIRIGPLVKINTSSGEPSELCWLAVSPDDRFVFSTEFGYSYLSSFHIDANRLSIAKDPASLKVPGDSTFRAIDGSVSSGPSDTWISPNGAYLYQIYGNASKLVGYATRPDGSLQEITSATIPYNSPEGLTGF